MTEELGSAAPVTEGLPASQILTSIVVSTIFDPLRDPRKVLLEDLGGKARPLELELAAEPAPLPSGPSELTIVALAGPSSLAILPQRNLGPLAWVPLAFQGPDSLAPASKPPDPVPVASPGLASSPPDLVSSPPDPALAVVPDPASIPPDPELLELLAQLAQAAILMVARPTLEQAPAARDPIWYTAH